MDDLELWVLRSTEVKSEDVFELAAYGLLFAPNTIWALISDRLATTRHLYLFPRMDDLEIWISGSTQGRSKDGIELAAYGFLFATQTTWALIYDRLATTHNRKRYAASSNPHLHSAGVDLETLN